MPNQQGYRGGCIYIASGTMGSHGGLTQESMLRRWVLKIMGIAADDILTTQVHALIFGNCQRIPPSPRTAPLPVHRLAVEGLFHHMLSNA
jgi:hypothetical protein